MEPRWFFLAAASVLYTLCSPPVGVQGGVVRGAVYKEHAYVSVKIEDPTGRLYGDTGLRYARLPGGEPRNTIRCGDFGDAPNRWRIQRDKLWLTTRGRVPFFTDEFLRIDFPELMEGELKWGPISEGPKPYSFVEGWGPVAMQGVFSQGIWLKFPLVAHYDYLPISNESVRLFLLRNTNVHYVRDDKGKISTVGGDMNKESWNFRVLKYAAKWGPNPLAEEHRIWIEGSWTEDPALEVSFKEPFHAYTSDRDDYYFVTESGKQYVAPKPAKQANRGDEYPGDLLDKEYVAPKPAKQGEQRKVLGRKVLGVWTDPLHPISHVLSHVDTGRTYAFGKLGDEASKKDGAGFCFELSSEKVEADRIPANLLKPVKADEPLKTVMEYANWLEAKQSRIKDRELLQSDPRLQGGLELTEDNPEIANLLERLRKLTGLSLSLEKNIENHRPVLGNRPKVSKTLAWELMDKLANWQLVDGRWSKTDTGYMLTARESVAEKEQADKKASEDHLTKVAAEEALLKAKFPLRLDARLQARLTVVEINPKLPDLLDRLRAATGVPLVVADNLVSHEPELGVVDFPNAQSWEVMEWIAATRLDNGQWEKTAGGYRLTGTSVAAASPRGTWWIWLMVTALALLPVGVILLVVVARTRRGAPGRDRS